MTIQERIAIARGDQPADLVMKNLQLVNVHTGEVYPAGIAISGTRIAAVGEGYEGKETLDLGGRYLAPGFIDAHVHIESSLCTPPEFAKAVLAHGVTTVVTDPHEIANVLGLDGIQFMLNAAKYGDLNMYVMASSCVPATHMETSGANLEAFDLQVFLDNPWVLGLAEMMNFPGVVFGDESVIAKIEMYKNRVLDGHCPALTGKQLNAYKTAGIRSDHECTTPAEALEKLRLGMVLFIRQATMAHNLLDLLPVVTPENSRRICFCTDDRHPADLIDDGSIDYMVREAIAHGIDPMTAFRMATLNTAEYFRLYDYGAIAPGYHADMIVFSDLQSPLPELVFRSGKLVARDGVFIGQSRTTPSTTRSTVNIKWDSVDFRIAARGTKIRVIGAKDNQVVTGHLMMDARVENGEVVADVERDILKIAVIERHRATGNIGKGFIHGMGLKRGAIAGTVAHDHHNLVVIGADDASMMCAAQAVAELGGGLVAVNGENVLATLPLPIAGLMSDQPIADVRDAVDNLVAAAHTLGTTMHDPFMVMGFVALEVIPNLKLTDLGLIDVEKFEEVSLFVQ